MEKFGHDTVVPYKDSGLGKKQQVGLMFDDIASRYDFLNRFLSGGRDIHWRKKAIAELKQMAPKRILDVATGTADMALLLNQIISPNEIIGIDISEGMLEIGRKKISNLGKDHNIRLEKGDCEDLHYPDNQFDAITVAFGVRNFEDLEKGLHEMLRVLKPAGKLVVLEFSQPGNSKFRMLCKFYLSRIAPFLVQIFSKKQAYQYLDKSIQAFPEGERFLRIMKKAGFTHTYLVPLSFGICSIYCGHK